MTTKPTRWLARRLGRRGAALATLGLACLLYGLSRFLTGYDPDRAGFYLHTLAPTAVQGLLWIIPGSLALYYSTKRGPGADVVGFMAIVVPLILWGASCLWSFLAFLVGVGDSSAGLARSLMYAALLALVLIIAGWAEVEHGYAPPRRRRRCRRGRGGAA